jgi:hypothetical protein
MWRKISPVSRLGRCHGACPGKRSLSHGLMEARFYVSDTSESIFATLSHEIRVWGYDSIEMSCGSFMMCEYRLHSGCLVECR